MLSYENSKTEINHFFYCKNKYEYTLLIADIKPISIVPHIVILKEVNAYKYCVKIIQIKYNFIFINVIIKIRLNLLT